MEVNEKWLKYMISWRAAWNKFVRDVLCARLDREQQDIVSSVQYNTRTAVSSGTARGKDFVAACCSLCFLYLTPNFNSKGELVGNTKVILTAPTGRQVYNIMMPEISRLYKRAKVLPGELQASRIKTGYEEWFLTGFKAAESMESWSGLHAVHIMFVVTEASGIPELVYDAIEGNMQGDSRELLVFNPNVPSGYAARAMSSDRFAHFRLDSLNAENVVSKKLIIPGQVDYEWVKDKVKTWCSRIQPSDFNEGEGDFQWEGGLYRPNDLFRVKVRGMFPKAASDCLIPYEWVILAQNNWKRIIEDKGVDYIPDVALSLGVDVAGMGRDSSILCPRYDNFVAELVCHKSGGKADHMRVAGMVVNEMNRSKVRRNSRALIDTIGEGAGVFSRLEEIGLQGATSCKFSESAKGLSDITGQYKFENMRAYLHWSVRDWLDPRNKNNPALPPDDELLEELTAIKWSFRSNGDIIIEPKDDIKERLGRSPDKSDSLCNTFYPFKDEGGLTAQDLENDNY